MGRAWVFREGILLSILAIVASCAGARGDSGLWADAGTGGSDATDPGSFVDGAPPNGQGPGPLGPSAPVTDFPAPVIDGNAPPNSATLFGPPTQGAGAGGPCLVEPESNVIYPQNWLRPR